MSVSAAFAALASLLLLLPRRPGDVGEPIPAPRLDAALLDAALDGAAPAALTDRQGTLVAANSAYQDGFGEGTPPTRLSDRLGDAARRAWRDGGEAGALTLDASRWRWSSTPRPARASPRSG